MHFLASCQALRKMHRRNLLERRSVGGLLLQSLVNDHPQGVVVARIPDPARRFVCVLVDEKSPPRTDGRLRKSSVAKLNVDIIGDLGSLTIGRARAVATAGPLPLTVRLVPTARLSGSAATLGLRRGESPSYHFHVPCTLKRTVRPSRQSKVPVQVDLGAGEYPLRMTCSSKPTFLTFRDLSRQSLSCSANGPLADTGRVVESLDSPVCPTFVLGCNRGRRRSVISGSISDFGQQQSAARAGDTAQGSLDVPRRRAQHRRQQDE